MAQPARSAASALERATKKAGDARSLFIRVEPAPTNLAERRAVLRTLQRHGQVEMFKKLHVRSPLPQPPSHEAAAHGTVGRQDDRSFVSIASSAQMARNLVMRSPMRFEFITDKAGALRPPAGSPDITSPVEPMETSEPPPESLRRETRQLSQKAFVLHIHARADYQHKTMIRRSPLHGPWPGDEDDAATTSLVYNALREVVPDGPGRDALCDWQTGGQLSDQARLQRSQPSSYQAAHIHDRRARRERASQAMSLSDILAARPPAFVEDQPGELPGRARPAGPEQDGSHIPTAVAGRPVAEGQEEASPSTRHAASRWGGQWGSAATKDPRRAGDG